MIFETRVVRQYMPSQSAQNGKRPDEFAGMNELIAPDDSGEWRYRDMQVLEGFSSGSSYVVHPTQSYSVPGVCASPSCEILVVWERYKED